MEPQDEPDRAGAHSTPASGRPAASVPDDPAASVPDDPEQRREEVAELSRATAGRRAADPVTSDDVVEGRVVPARPVAAGGLERAVVGVAVGLAAGALAVLGVRRGSRR